MHKGGYKKGKGRMMLESAMREVHESVPKSVRKSGKTGKAKEEMMQAIAFSKARRKGARLHKPKATSAKVFS